MRHSTIKTFCVVVAMLVTSLLYFHQYFLRTIRENKMLVGRKKLSTERTVRVNNILVGRTVRENKILETRRSSPSNSPYYELTFETSDEQRKVVPGHNISSPPLQSPPLLFSSNKTVPQILVHVKDTQYNIFIFSAVVGNSSRKAKFDRVVFNVWVDRKYSNSTNFKCCLRYKSRRLLTTNLITKVDWLFIDHTKIQAKQYVFSNPRGSLRDALVSATMIYNQTNCPKSVVWYVTPTYAFRHENEIAVCTKVAYGPLPADEIISWFEIHRSMGVNKVLTYTDNLNPTAQRVLDYYSSIGLAEVYPFVVPKYGKGRQAVASIGVKNYQAWNDEQIPVYDCLEKLRGYKYLAVIDFDEYIIPQQGGNLRALFERLWKQRPWAAGFQLLVQLHITSWGSTNSSGNFITQRYLNRTKPMVDRRKNVVMPERLSAGGLSTHDFWPDYKMKYLKIKCSSSSATIHHYRSCRKDWDKKKNKIKCLDLQRFTDPIVANAMLSVEKGALELKRELFQEIENT